MTPAVTWGLKITTSRQRMRRIWLHTDTRGNRSQHIFDTWLTDIKLETHSFNITYGFRLLDLKSGFPQKLLWINHQKRSTEKVQVIWRIPCTLYPRRHFPDVILASYVLIKQTVGKLSDQIELYFKLIVDVHTMSCTIPFTMCLEEA